MKPDEIVTLFDYAWWARDRLLAAADGMTEEDFACDNGFTYKSLRGILVHAMDAEESWCSRFLGEAVAGEPGVDEIVSVGALKSQWVITEARCGATWRA